MRKTKKIIITALLLALKIVLSRFLSIRTPIVKISFAAIPTMLCGIWLGPLWTTLLCLIEDLIGATLFPSGPFFIGYTISAVLSGFVYGILLYKKDINSMSNKKFIFRVILSVVIVNLLINLGLNTLWSSITSGKAFKVIFVTRAIKEVIMTIVNIVVILFINKITEKPFDKYIRSTDD